MEGLGVGLALLSVIDRAGDVGLDADDRLDALVLRGLVERDRAVQRAVVGDREAVEALRGRRIDQLRDPAEAVEEAELGVDVEMGEVVRGEGHGAPMVAPRRSLGVHGRVARTLGAIGRPGASSAADVRRRAPTSRSASRVRRRRPRNDCRSPFRDRLGTVAIVIEAEATADQLERQSAPRPVRPRIRASRARTYGANRPPCPSKITPVSRTARRGRPGPRRAWTHGVTGDRATTRSPTTSDQRCPDRSSEAVLVGRDWRPTVTRHRGHRSARDAVAVDHDRSTGARASAGARLPATARAR